MFSLTREISPSTAEFGIQCAPCEAINFREQSFEGSAFNDPAARAISEQPDRLGTECFVTFSFPCYSLRRRFPFGLDREEQSIHFIICPILQSGPIPHLIKFFGLGSIYSHLMRITNKWDFIFQIFTAQFASS